MSFDFQKYFKLWFSPVDSLRLDIFRTMIGLSLFFYMRFRWAYADEWLTQKGYHLSPAYDPYFDRVIPLLTEPWLTVFGIVFFSSIILFTIGWKIRLTALTSFLCLLYVSAADPLAFFSPNKVLICTLAVFIFSSEGRCWLSSTEPRYISAWPLRTLRAFIIIHLFTAGWSKVVFGEWLYNPYVLWTQIQGTFCTDFAAFLLRHLPVKAWTFLQMMSLLFELLVPVFFLSFLGYYAER
jgi:hypothetical protein